MTYRYDFADRSGEYAVAIDQLSGSGYSLDDKAYPRALGDVVARPIADLLSIAMAVYAADRLSPRGSGWIRSIAIRIVVDNEEKWRSVRCGLESLLGLLTDDEWALEFVSGRALRLSEAEATLFPANDAEIGAVALFSGGLDSLAGAARWLDEAGAALLLVGAASSTVVGRDQWQLARKLRDSVGARVTYLRVPLKLRRSLSREASQRSRSFLYLTLGLAAAHSIRCSRLLVFENGYGAYNPRLDEQQTGSQANRGTHPYTLRRFGSIMKSVGIPIDVELPHEGETKAEHLAAMPPWAHSLIALTSSCDSYPLRGPQTHCGRCGSCLLRRQSLLAAGLAQHDRGDYQWWPFEQPVSGGGTMVRMARQAWQFGRTARIESWADAEALWPSLSLDPDMSWIEQSRVVRLLRAYHAEWEAIVLRSPSLRAAVGWPASVGVTT